MLPNLRLLGLAALALVALPACDSASTSATDGSGGSGGTGTSSFTVQSVSVTNGQVWQINRPIDVTFSKDVDFATVGLNTIAISTPSGLSATGVFSATSDPRKVRFQPACPTQSDNSDAGLVPGGTTYTVHVLDTDDNGVTVRDTAGTPVSQGVSVSFTTPISTDSQALFLDTVPGPPSVRVRNRAGVSSTDVNATYLETAEGERFYFYQQVATQQGALIPPGGSEYLPGINKYSDALTRWSVVVHFNQPIIASDDNITSDLITLEYEPIAGLEVFESFGSSVELLANCTATGAVVRVTPQGVVPQGKRMRLNVRQGFSDITGDSLPSDLVGAARMQIDVSSNAFGREFDEITEGFEASSGTPGSREDGVTPLGVPRAEWGSGELQASFDFGGTGGPGGDFDWVVGFSGPETVILDTTSSQILGGPDGIPTVTQTVINGVLDVDDFRILPGSRVIVIGPNPLTVLAKGDVEVWGELLVNGSDNPGVGTLNTTNQPEFGASGNGGGGRGGTGSFLTSQSTPKGGDGFGAFAQANRGGVGGETTYSTGGTNNRRGSGGGGGRLGPDVYYDHDDDSDTGLVRAQLLIGLDAESGRGGAPNGKGAISQAVRAVGGAIGEEPFLDDSDVNNFFGQMITVENSLIVGELDGIHAGAGGGGGGDAVSSNSFPLVPFQIGGDEKGCGGGGGAGGIRILAIGDIHVYEGGRITAEGGEGGGGENTNFFDRVGGGSGGGSGGHMIFSTAGSVIVDGLPENSLGWYKDYEFGANWPAFAEVRGVSAVGGQGGAGQQDYGGSGANGGTSWRCDCIPREFVDVEPIGCPENSGGVDDVPPYRCVGCFSIATTGFNDAQGPVLAAGGDGGPGIIQLHVADPANNILLPDVTAQPSQAGRKYGQATLTNGVATIRALDPTQGFSPPPLGWLNPVEEQARIDQLAIDQPGLSGVVSMAEKMVPFFGRESKAQSTWIPLGLARVSPSGAPLTFSFDGTDAQGFITHGGLGDTVEALPPVIGPDPLGDAGAGTLPFITGGGTSIVFDAAGMPDAYRVNPAMLERFSVVLANSDQNPSLSKTFEIVSATYDAGLDRLTCTIGMGDLEDFVASTIWASLRPHYFRVTTGGVLDNYPANMGIQLRFDATIADVAGNPSTGGAFSASTGGLATADIAALNNATPWDFVRFEALFDLNISGDPANLDLGAPLPGLLFVKIPYEFGAE